MKIIPLWGDCDVCGGTGETTEKKQTSPAGGIEDVRVPCSRCNNTGKTRTDSLHRALCLDEDGDALLDLSFEPAGEIVCASRQDKTCGALCAAFMVLMDPKGEQHFAACAAMGKHILGTLEIDDA